MKKIKFYDKKILEQLASTENDLILSFNSMDYITVNNIIDVLDRNDIEEYEILNADINVKFSFNIVADDKFKSIDITLDVVDIFGVIKVMDLNEDKVIEINLKDYTFEYISELAISNEIEVDDIEVDFREKFIALN